MGSATSSAAKHVAKRSYPSVTKPKTNPINTTKQATATTTPTSSTTVEGNEFDKAMVDVKDDDFLQKMNQLHVKSIDPAVSIEGFFRFL